ncbi:unnamed protein product, partial [Ectocarpus sp. 4 AP-2014]
VPSYAAFQHFPCTFHGVAPRKTRGRGRPPLRPTVHNSSTVQNVGREIWNVRVRSEAYERVWKSAARRARAGVRPRRGASSGCLTIHTERRRPHDEAVLNPQQTGPPPPDALQLSTAVHMCMHMCMYLQHVGMQLLALT